jgi:methylated-DNA-[protein]-cysteine S-methyltransferase
VWAAVAEVSCGTTVAYRTLAMRLGNPRSSRAVGLANACNPLSIVVPCHRVIGSNGALVGYAGGHERKQWLLAHETQQRQQDRRTSTSVDGQSATYERQR